MSNTVNELCLLYDVRALGVETLFILEAACVFRVRYGLRLKKQLIIQLLTEQHKQMPALRQMDFAFGGGWQGV
jgi:hypothetical protein